jgi:NADH dehydrogenase
MATFLKIFIVVLLVVFLAHGLVAWLRPDVTQRLSFLPGDIKYESSGGNVRVYFPIVTSIVLSVVLTDERSVADAVAGAYGVVNAVSLYVEHGRETFHSVHVESAQRVAAQARLAGVERLIHVSGIGSDPASSSLYIRKRGEGELAVRAAFANATLVRPAVMFGPDDAFLTALLKFLSQLPIYPMFGRGLTRLQPAYVEDVAEAITRALQRTEKRPITFECGGPRAYSYEELLKTVAHEANLKPMLISIPFAFWYLLAWFAEMLPSPPITRNQVDLMQIDNVASPEIPGFGELGISPLSIEEILPEILWDH